ncbi:pentatricopeptide repeat-containing protein At5g13770, chloroplastic [Juglans microcarpa x Juglans regia]|uniref:pentatricopeptide repeat-containing protein At5g13770, chloroplastic n=1 Tax=Juglans microcarpa x Juglans regia TaxID=2249226 RepID=UPI001B7F465A|nr:pentatricopeptide repeat-containing protein At5g13770, chloroplastic [Juglans microcarpa x Juglans regia]
MTISTCSDWSVACINSCRNSHRFNLIPTCKTLPFFSVTRPRFLNFDVYSSGCSSPTLEEPSNSLPVIELNLEFPDSERCQKPDCGNLNDILRGLFADPQTQELAYEYYEKVKQRPEFRPERSTLKHVIRYLLSSSKWGLILQVCEDFRNYQVFPDSSTCSKLIRICIRARKFKIVETLLEDCKANGEVCVSAFVSAMSGYNKLHMYRSTIAAFRRMESSGVLPDLKCYCPIMEAYAKTGDSERVVELFRELQSTQLDFYSSPFCGQIYGILCKSLSESGRAFEALEYFQEMTKKEIILKDSSVYSSLICSFARMREVKVAEQLLEEAKSKRMLRDPEAYLKLVLMYVEEGQMEKTLEIVKAMRDWRLRIPDCIFCAIVNGYSKKRGFQAAVKVYEELISQGCEAGQVTYSSIINAYSQLELYSKAEMAFSEMENKGLDKSVVAYSSIIVMYGRMGRVRDAMRALAKMKERGCEPNVWIYNSLMEIHGKAKNLRQVEKLWKEMKRRKVCADKISYTIIISAYGKARQFETCVRYYKEFRSNGGVIDRVMAGIMVGVFSKSNRIGDLLKLLQDMRSQGTEFDGRLYSSALAALRDAGLQVQAQWLQDCFASKMNLNS